MARLRKVDKLPEEIQAEIGRLRKNGHTIDQILAHLRTLGVGEKDLSRTGLGAYVQGLDEIVKRMQETRGVADAIMDRLGDGDADDRLFRLNKELLHGAIYKLQMAAAVGGEDAPEFTPQDLQFLSRSLQQLASASKVDLDRIAAAEKRAAAKALAAAAVQATRTAREAGLSAETVELIKSRILGVAA